MPQMQNLIEVAQSACIRRVTPTGTDARTHGPTWRTWPLRTLTAETCRRVRSFGPPHGFGMVNPVASLAIKPE